MLRRTLLLIVACSLGFTCLNAQEKKTKQVFHKQFVEDFDKPTSKYFREMRQGRPDEKDFRYFSGYPSYVEKGTDVMLYRIDPSDPAGPGKGPSMESRHYTYYGSYSARIRIPDVTKVQPDVGAVVGYFTYNFENGENLSEIDWEWLIADPEIVYIGTWTGDSSSLQRVGRTINLAKGIIYETIYYYGADNHTPHPLSGKQAQPESVPVIKDFNAATNFYTYGFDWYPDRVVWWILHPETEEKIVLWDYPGPTPVFSGIPSAPTYYCMNFWYTEGWSVVTNPKSIERPRYPYEVEIDWMSYTPFKEFAK